MESKIMEVNNLANLCKLRKEKYIDASIGVLKNDHHKLISFGIIEKMIRNNINRITFNYSSILGDKEFNELMCKWIFKDKLNCYYSSGYVMGATAALNFAFKKCCKGEKIIIPSPFWPNYDLIAKENNKEIIRFDFLDLNQKFNCNALKGIIKSDKDDISILINDPCSNPLGYTLSIIEWEELLILLSRESQFRKITLILDLAYIDFTFSDYHLVFTLIEKYLSENLNAILCYSFSKSFSLYGYRAGMIIGQFNLKKDKEEFEKNLKCYIRSTWSSCNNLLTTLFTKGLKNKLLQRLIKIKQKRNRDLLKKRFNYFYRLASKYGIEYFKFHEGFFVFIKGIDVNKTYSLLKNKNIFVVPFKEGIRISIASINKKEILLILKEINKINH